MNDRKQALYGDDLDDLTAALGDGSADDRELRMRCVQEARQIPGVSGTGDVMVAARRIMRFVSEGTTPTLRRIDGSRPAVARTADEASE